jgi:hypothetical protein
MKKLILLLSLLSSPVFAAEVYIDQAGGAATVDILQENGMNRVNAESDPALLSGDDIILNILQSGDLNTADLYFDQNANSTDFSYYATGSFNEILAIIFGGVNNYFLTTITGDTNIVTACKNLYTTTCNGVIVNNTQNTLTLVGNNNEINYALDSGDAINNINIGSTVPSDFNVINLTQTGAGEHMATITIDGNNNLVDLVQN